MINYIVNKLVSKYRIDKQEALLFYYELAKRRKLEHLVQNIDKYPCYEALKSFYYGGN